MREKITEQSKKPYVSPAADVAVFISESHISLLSDGNVDSSGWVEEEE